MAIEYAAKYSGKVDERFAVASLTNQAVNNDYDFVDVNVVKVYSIPTVALGNYGTSGTSRYGTPADLQNSVQTLTLAQDKAFTFIIDSKAADDTAGAMEAGRALRRQVDEVVIPEIDKYRLSVLATKAGKTVTGSITKSNAYDAFLDGTNAMRDAGVPETGRLCYCSPAFYKAIKQDESFIKASDVAQNMLVTGSVGMVDGTNLIPVPTSYLPTGVNFIMTHKVACVGPVKLESYKIHDNPPGINGKLVEGRIRFDAFVLDSKKAAVYAHKTTA